MTEHSPLGASSAERWMNCPGSVTMIKELELPETDEPSYRAEGTAMHEAAAWALNNGGEAWEIAGMEFYGQVITPEMAEGVGVYLDYVRPLARAIDTFGIEYRVSSPVHPLFFGTADFWALAPWSEMGNALHVVDLKGGKGIVVDPEDNAQLKYYAFGVVETLERERSYQIGDDVAVVLTIVQPRAFHTAGVVRSWATTAGDIREWVHTELVPAMAAAEIDGTLDAGPWCRFCPAKLACPMLTGLFRAAALASDQKIVQSNEMLGLSARYVKAVEHYLKAFREEGLRRAMEGQVIPHTKLVKQKANRVWTEDGRAMAEATFGEKAFTTPELKSPAGIDELPGGKKFTKEYAHTPDAGLKWVTEDEPGVAQNVKTLQESQAAFVAAVTAEE